MMLHGRVGLVLLQKVPLRRHCVGQIAARRVLLNVRNMSQERNKDAGHKVPKTSAVSSENIDPEIVAYQKHQSSVPRISLAEETRTLVSNGKFGVLSTLSSKEEPGFPVGSVVEYAPDDSGKPIFSFSSLSPHTNDILENERCSLTIMAEGFRGISDARVNIIGRVVPVADEAIAAAKEIYLTNHPMSFWVEFGDFTWFKMEEILSARLVGGFGRAGKVSQKEYFAADVDPVAKFSAPVCGHMNDDHADATVAMVKHYIGITVDSARMLSLDRLGINIACERDSQQFKARLPFPREAENRKMIKELIVEMTKAASAASN